jgi:NAD(P)-dependent dehydrogenase (short-subunit alcohol dehydrogenase family)
METKSDIRDLEGQTALVTGATSGIGRAIAMRLSREGASVIVHGRDSERGAETVEAIEAEGGHARFIGADLGDTGSVGDLITEVGHVEVLVNNAGVSFFGETAELDAEGFDQLFDANVRAPYLLVAALGPKMAANGNGAIINVSSMSGTVGLAAAAAYGATKASLASMTRSWAAEFSPAGVRVNAISPGPVKKREPSAVIDALAATTPMDRAAEPEEIAEVVAFLASPRASYMTGATIAVDGGRTAI